MERCLYVEEFSEFDRRSEKEVSCNFFYPLTKEDKRDLDSVANIKDDRDYLVYALSDKNPAVRCEAILHLKNLRILSVLFIIEENLMIKDIIRHKMCSLFN
jgi:hypothetical protein